MRLLLISCGCFAITFWDIFCVKRWQFWSENQWRLWKLLLSGFCMVSKLENTLLSNIWCVLFSLWWFTISTVKLKKEVTGWYSFRIRSMTDTKNHWKAAFHKENWIKWNEEISPVSGETPLKLTCQTEPCTNSRKWF